MSIVKSKVLLIIPTLNQGGAERVMSELANEFDILGHEVHLCLLANGDDFYKVNNEVKVYRLGFENKSAVQKKVSEINTFFKLRRLMKKIKPDIALSFMEKYNVLTILASAFLDHKVFVSDRSNPRKKLPPYLFYLKKKIYRYATGVVAQTSLAKEILLQTTAHPNIEIIPNPLKQISLDLNDKKENIILNIGRMVPEKGQEYLIESFLKMNLPNWKLVILGDGPLRMQLERQVKESEFKAKGQILMPGAVKNIDQWLSRAAIFAFPSVSEGFPNALVEAMSAGLPCVSFDCDAGPEDIIVNNENGYLVKTKDTSAFKAILEELCDNPDLRTNIGNKAKNVSTTLNREKIALKYLEFFFRSN